MGKKVDWSVVDWTKDDLHIAMILDVARSAVWSKRKELGIPNPKTGQGWGKSKRK
jgi:hypothetical protein